MNLSVFAHSAPAVNVWDWGEPLGLAVFGVGIGLTLFLVALTLKTLASIEDKKKK